MKHTGYWGVKHHAFLNLAVDRCDQVAARTDRFITVNRGSRISSVGCDALETRKFLFACPKSNEDSLVLHRQHSFSFVT
jgi:hypothetical protein